MTDTPLPPAVRHGVSLIGAPTDVGAGSQGARMGPEALRVAGIHQTIARFGVPVRDIQHRSITNIDQSNTNSPLCFLSSNNKKNSRLDKLLWIETLFFKGLGVGLLMYVTDFINNEIKQKRWSKEETQVFLRIKYN